MKKKNLQLARTMLISGIGAGINYLITFLLTPYITSTIGIEAYGFVSMAKTAVSYAQIFTIALTTFVVRYIFVAYHKADMEGANSYYSSSIAACISIAGGIFVLILPAIVKLEYLLNIPEELVFSVKLLFVTVFLNFVMQTVITPFGASAYIKDRLDLSGILQILAYGADALTLIVFIRCFVPSVWFVGVGALASSAVLLIGNMAVTRRLTPELRFQGKLLSFSKIKTMISNGIWNSVNSLGNVLNSGLDLIISNLMLSGIATGQISVAKTVGTMLNGLYALIFQPFQPALLKAYTSGNKETILYELTKAMKICGYFSNVILAGFFALGRVYYELWMPGQDTNTLYLLTLVTILTGLTTGTMLPVYYVYTMTVKNKLPCLVTIAGGFLNIFSMFLLLKFTDWGAYAIVATTAVITLGINLFFNPIYAAGCLKTSARPIYRTLIRHLVSACVMSSVFLLIEAVVDPSNWFTLIGTAMMMAAVGVPIHFYIQNIRKDGSRKQ